MKFSFAPLAAFALLVTPGCAPEGDEVRNIILLIADGAGAGAWTAAVHADVPLAVKGMPVTGLVDTRSALHKVSDSAAGASAYATGERVTNRTIAVGPAEACPLPRSADTVAGEWPDGCEPIPGWFAMARDKGRATGVVTTTYVVDATPAAFVAHSPSRYWREAIAEQFVDFGLDVMLGGGRRYFSADRRADGHDLVAELCGRAHCLFSAEALAAHEPDDRPLVGLFADEDMDDLDERPIDLPAMVGVALARLGRNDSGFVAIFETESTDNFQHSNASLERITADMLEFDRAVGVALDFARRTPGTLVIATADHETGGFTLVQTGDDFRLNYATGGHTAALIPLFAAGTGAERFGGLRDNFEIGGMLMEIVRGW